jgi:ankyrin repeat protein
MRLIFLALVSFALVVPTPAVAQDLRVVTAAAEQDAATVASLLADGVDPNATRADGVTALLWAAHWDDLHTTDRLLAAGADPNVADDHGVAPLERAAENASLPMVERLLAAGARAAVAQTSGLTPLMTASRTGNAALVRALLDAGAVVNATTVETNSTALMWALAAPHHDIVRLLLSRDADPTIETTPGFTPLMVAARNGDTEMAAALIDAGVDVNTPSCDGTDVLAYSIAAGRPAFALFLLERGADPNSWLGGVSALHAAAGGVSTWLTEWTARHGRVGGARLSAQDRLTLVEALLARGVDPNAKVTSSAMLMYYIGYPKKGAFEPFAPGTGDLKGATPLWVAAFEMNGAPSLIYSVIPSFQSSSVDVLRALIDGGADLTLASDDGTTPLMMAAGLGKATYTPREPRGVPSSSAEAAVRFLVEAGADVNAVNEADFTALHGATFRGLNEVVEYLVAQGADIDARDFRGRTAYRMAEGAKQSFQFQSWPDTAELLARLGADTALGVPGTVQERLRDVPVTTTTDQP